MVLPGGSPEADTTQPTDTTPDASADSVAVPASPLDSDFTQGFRALLADRPADTLEAISDEPTAEVQPVGQATETPAEAPAEPAAPDPAEAAKPEPPKAEAPPPDAQVTIPEDVLAAAVERHLQSISDAAAAKKQQDDATAKANEAAERLIGKPGEMAELLQRRAVANRTNDWSAWDNDDEERLTALTEGALVYQPILERAKADAASEARQRVEHAETANERLLAGWAGQFEEAANLILPGIDGKELIAAPGIAAVVTYSHAAGAASRQGEIDHLEAQLAEARGLAFRSQPPLETAGGASASGRGRAGLSPDASPREEFAAGFAGSAPSPSGNGRR